jgi:nicotinate-nucleotide pyrophosphorylase (carboxylating)
MTDPRDHVFAAVSELTVTAAVIADDAGVVCGVSAAVASTDELGFHLDEILTEGASVRSGDAVCRFRASPKQVALAEERLIGLLGKPSGIATATREFVEQADGKLRVVSGAWKKLPFSQRDMIRNAIQCGGAEPRITTTPFVYIDKNMARILGGPTPALAAASGLPGQKVVQLGGGDTLPDAACELASAGADIIFVDTGDRADVALVDEALRAKGMRGRVQLAFAGGLKPVDLDGLAELGVDIVDVGRAIVDAPLVDMHLAVLDIDGGRK